MGRRSFYYAVENAASDLKMNYEHAVDLSQSAARKQTGPGEQVPVVERPQGEFREWYKQRAREIYDSLMLNMNLLRNSEARSIADAPAQEAVAAMQILAMRDNISQDELDLYYEQYGKHNYNVAKALDTIARKNDLRPSYATYEGLDYARIERDIESMTMIDQLESHNSSPSTAITVIVSDVHDELGISDGANF